MSADLMPLTAEEIELPAPDYPAGPQGEDGFVFLGENLYAADTVRRLLAESAAAKDAEIAALHQRVERLSLRHFAAVDEVPLARECADFATSLRSANNVQIALGNRPVSSFVRAVDLFERAAIALTELPSDVLRQRAERDEAGLRGVIAHWDEFGPEHGFDEAIDCARRGLAASQPSADAPARGG